MLRLVPEGAVLALVVGLAATLAVLTDLTVLLLFLLSLDRSDGPLVVPEVVLELDLLPLVDQLLTD